MGLLEDDRGRVMAEGIPFDMSEWDFLTHFDKIHAPISMSRHADDLDPWQEAAAEDAASQARNEVRSIVQRHMRGGRVFPDTLGDEITAYLDACDQGIAHETATIIVHQLADVLAGNYEEDLRRHFSRRMWDLLETEVLEEESGILLDHENETSESLTTRHFLRNLERSFGLPSGIAGTEKES